MIEWNKFPEAAPEESGKYMILEDAGDISTMTYSVKHRTFNCQDRYDEDEAERWSCNKYIKAWAPIPALPDWLRG